MSPPQAAAKLLAGDLRAARKRLHMTAAIMAAQIGISESALRRIENGTSRHAHADTTMKIFAWATSRGYAHFGGCRLRPVADTPESVAKKAQAARVWGELFEALGRSE